jgi:peptidoglycan/xylan/chitin deacetylase (PgdA/CDA1 family)
MTVRAELPFREAAVLARRRGYTDAQQLRGTAARQSDLQLGRFNDIGMRGMTLRRSLLAMRSAGEILVNATTTPFSGRPAFTGWQKFALAYFYWRGVQAGCDADTWQRLIHGPVILMYHAVGGANEPASQYVIPERDFAAQMDSLHRRRYNVISLDALLQHRHKGELPPARSVVITFDDGYRDNHALAWPILQKHGFAATIFLVSDAMGGSNGWDAGGALLGRPLLTWQEAGAMQAAGMHMGGHSRTHRPLSGLSDAVLTDEVAGSKEIIEKMLRLPVSTFAYPHGRYDDATVAAVDRAGYTGACCSVPGVNDPAICDRTLRRLEVRGTDSLFEFATMLNAGKNRMLSRLIRSE